MVSKRETKQKKAIESIVGKSDTFFTAQDLYKKLKKDNPKIGIATVYRFLKELQKERLIHSYSCDRKKIYSKKEINHSHFICELCGVRRHINLEKIDFMKKFISEYVCHIQIEINGICKDCKIGTTKDI